MTVSPSLRPFLMSGIDTLHGTTTVKPCVDVGALFIFTGTLEVHAVWSRWAGTLLLRERFAKPSFMGWPAPPRRPDGQAWDRQGRQDIEAVWMAEGYWVAVLGT